MRPIWRQLLILVLVTSPVAAQSARTATDLTHAAQIFLRTLTKAQREQAMFPFDSEERFRWFFTPVERHGITLKTMDPAQRDAAFALLRAGLSAKGYKKVEVIRHLEELLRQMQPQFANLRDPELYYVTFFGDPSTTEPWGWRYEGHHVSLHWTVIGGHVVGDSPQFLGSNPAEVREGTMKGTRPLADEEDLGRALAESFSSEQRQQGILAESVPEEIATAELRKAGIQADTGIAYASLDKKQRGIMLALIDEYLHVQPVPRAQARLARVRAAGLDSVKFAWIGSLVPGERFYYRMQGKTFLIEFDKVQSNHAHAVWRDFAGDFGEDALADHYQNSPHHQHVADHPTK